MKRKTWQRLASRPITATVRSIAVIVLGAACIGQGGTATTVGVEQSDPNATFLPTSEREEATSSLPPFEVLIEQVDPIYGYGDYSAYPYSKVPWGLVTAAEIACMRDQGWPVEPIGDTGISWLAIPFEQNEAAQVGFARCVAGLSIPEYGVESGVEVENIYTFWVDVLKPCLEAEGYDIPDPPSVDSFVENYPDVEWVPWRYVSNTSSELEARCPQSPHDYGAGLGP
ncbi:MAG: hypothetical protein QY307_05635 [Acidimicrobiia bacterium]|nr:MAG: hypothetical protein QY307_05635 [Acidimicrobiia bacterium]